MVRPCHHGLLHQLHPPVCDASDLGEVYNSRAVDHRRYHGSGRLGRDEQCQLLPGAAFTEYLRDVGTAHVRVTVGHPQCNGLTGRMIRTLTDRLTVLIMEDGTSMPDLLPTIACSMNITHSESLRRTPFELLYGFIAPLPGKPAPERSSQGIGARSAEHQETL